jgi:hypothetical protein
MSARMKASLSVISRYLPVEKWVKDIRLEVIPLRFASTVLREPGWKLPSAPLASL